jgi:hypothetical protein
MAVMELIVGRMEVEPCCVLLRAVTLLNDLKNGQVKSMVNNLSSIRRSFQKGVFSFLSHFASLPFWVLFNASFQSSPAEPGSPGGDQNVVGQMKAGTDRRLTSIIS